MTGRLSTETTVARLQRTVEELKSIVRDGAWNKSAILGQPMPGPDWPDVFVLMPYTKALNRVYDDQIKQAASKLKLRLGRADKFFGTEAIMADIWSAINAARIVVADCTGRNPNVFYEIGLAHAIGKRTILIAQSMEDVPFDLRSLRIIIYKRRDMETFKKTLVETIKKCCQI
jgi:hypothetical protein